MPRCAFAALLLAACAASPASSTPSSSPGAPSSSAAQSGAPSSSAAQSSAALHATIDLAASRVKSAADLVVHVRIINGTTATIRYRMPFLESAILHLEVRDRVGKPQYPGPPPTPTGDDGTHAKDLAPGKSIDLTYRGSDFFASLPPAGEYEVKFEDPTPTYATPSVALESDWARFEIRP